jgi:hypothetical protein
VRVRDEWNGDELLRARRRADGRAVIGMGAQVSNEMQGQAHVISGDLKRSIHAAKVDTMGTVGATTSTVRTGPDTVELEVGSWIAYACVENNRGGTHRFADNGWRLAEPTFDGILQRAYREEDM